MLNAGIEMSPGQIVDSCKEKLGGVKTPKSIEVWDEVPKTAVGKTDKKAIRAKFWGQSDRLVN